MKKEWYIQINGEREGPYSVADLKKDQRITPDTLVWKEGYPDWVPIGKVRELRELFEDDDDANDDKPSFVKEMSARITPDGLILDLRRDPPHPVLWIIFIILLLFYLVYKLL